MKVERTLRLRFVTASAAIPALRAERGSLGARIRSHDLPRRADPPNQFFRKLIYASETRQLRSIPELGADSFERRLAIV